MYISFPRFVGDVPHAHVQLHTAEVQSEQLDTQLADEDDWGEDDWGGDGDPENCSSLGNTAHLTQLERSAALI